MDCAQQAFRLLFAPSGGQRSLCYISGQILLGAFINPIMFLQKYPSLIRAEQNEPWEGGWQTAQKQDKRRSAKKIKSNSHITKSSNSSETKMLWQGLLVGRGLEKIILAEWSDG